MFSSNEVKGQLEKILQSPEFTSSSRLCSLLRYVVEETLSGRADKIKAYTIALEVFERDASFDPQADTMVRIYAGRLRRELAHYYNTAGITDTILIEIPKGGYVPVFCSRKPVTDSSNGPRDHSASIKSGKTVLPEFLHKYKMAILPVIIGTLILVFGSSVFEKENTAHSDPFGRATIAWAGIKNLSAEPGNNSVANSINEQTLIALSRYSNAKVLSPPSFDQTAMVPPGARFILSGDLTTAGEELKVRVKLTEAESGLHLWGESYSRNRRAASMLYLEEDVSNRIAVAVADEFGIIQSHLIQAARRKNDRERTPQDALLLYYDYISDMNPESNLRAKKGLEQAVQTHPDFAPGWAALAGIYMDIFKHFDGDSSYLHQSVAAIRKAEQINPHDQHVQEHRALVAFSTGQLADLFDAADKQLKLNPNATMVGQIGLYFTLIGEYKRGLSLIENVKNKNRYYPGFLHFGPYFYYFQKGEYEKALKESEQVNMPELYWDPLSRAAVLGALGNITAAGEAVQELLNLKPDFRERGRETMRRALYLEQHLNMLLSGLEKAGLNDIE